MSDIISLGFIGLNGRGLSQYNMILDMPDVRVPVICDLIPERMEKAAALSEEKGAPRPDQTTDYRELVARDDIQAVIISTSWNAHMPIAMAAMEHGKYAAFEVGPSNSVEECWDLVKTYERTGVPCMMLENCCYGRLELMALNMTREGALGRLMYGAGGYHHDLSKHYARFDTIRGTHNLRRNGDLYTTHALGPLAKAFSVNRGNRMLMVNSVATEAYQLRQTAKELYPADDPRAESDFRMGDVITTIIKLTGGETLVITHDTMLPRPYSRGNIYQGTRGLLMEDKDAAFLQSAEQKARGEENWTPLAQLEDKYGSPLWKWYDASGIQAGHGGMDYLVIRAFLEAARDGRPTPIDAYDSASWAVISTLSEHSVAMGGAPVPVPDFTNGRWLERAPEEKWRYSL